MASGDATALGPIAETPIADDAEKAIQEELIKMEAKHAESMARVASLQSRYSETEEMEKRLSDSMGGVASMQSAEVAMEAKTSDSMAKVASMQSAVSRELEKVASMRSAGSATSTEAIRKMQTTRCTTFHIPALNGRPNGGKPSLRTRPVLTSCDPQVRKQFTLSIYAMLTGQVTVVALITAVVTAGILSPSWLPKEFGSWLPNDLAWTGPTTPEWWPDYPFNILIALFPALPCTALPFLALSLSRYGQKTRRFFVVACTLITGFSVGLLTYLESSFPTLCICVVLTSLVFHTFGISVNFISFLASFGQVEPKASKMEMMGQESRLTGPEKLICLSYDEEASYTRASLVLAGLSWIAATVTSALVVAFCDLNWLPWSFAAPTAGLFVLYFTYGVEKQVRRCSPMEKECAMINLSIDFFFFVAQVLTFDTSILQSRELGSARPNPVAKGSFRYTMKQVSSGVTRSTTAGTSATKSISIPKGPAPPMETVAV